MPLTSPTDLTNWITLVSTLGTLIAGAMWVMHRWVEGLRTEVESKLSLERRWMGDELQRARQDFRTVDQAILAQLDKLVVRLERIQEEAARREDMVTLTKSLDDLRREVARLSVGLAQISPRRARVSAAG